MEAILFEKDANPKICRLTIKSRADLTGHAKPHPRIFVVRDTELSRLKGLPDFKTARFQRQASGKMLRGYSSNREEFWFIYSLYKINGKLRNALNDLLAAASGSGCCKLYVIGVRTGDKSEEELWTKDTRQTWCYRDLYQELQPETDIPSPLKPKLSSTDERAKTLLNLIKLSNALLKEPESLKNKYRGSSPSCQLVRQMILKSSLQDCRVLITGDAGTGKELVAEAIHEMTIKRRNKPHKTLNCSAISPKIVEGELFGVVEGFPERQSKRKIGLWEAADKGTLFLDEIGDLPIEHQPKILRAIETGRIRPVGGNEEISVDVRLIAATNARLLRAVEKGNFRADLLSRLREFHIETPSLGDHLADVPEIANGLWQEISGQPDAVLKDECIEILKNSCSSWTGNVRDMRNILKQLYMLFQSDPVEGLQCLISMYQNEGSDAPQSDMLSVELLDLIETLARASHESWRSQRESEGWTWGPVRVEMEGKKQNPDMTPYEQLSDNQKAYAREEAKVVIKTLLSEGMRIVR